LKLSSHEESQKGNPIYHTNCPKYTKFITGPAPIYYLTCLGEALDMYFIITVIVQNSNGSINPLKKMYLGLLERTINDNFQF